MHVSMAGNAQDPAILDEGRMVFIVADELRRKSYSALVAGDRITDDGLGPHKIDEEAEAVAAATEEPTLFTVARRWQIEAHGRDAVGWVQRGKEVGSVTVIEEEEAEEGRLHVMFAETAEESGVGEDAVPTLADERGTGE